MHISYSELKTWAECAWKHKLIYKDKIKKFVGNEYTAFGRSLHLLCEHAIEDKIKKKTTMTFGMLLLKKK